MTRELNFAPAADMLAEAIAYVRPHLTRGDISERLRCLWAGAKAASDLGGADVVEDEFLTLARDCGLVAELGCNADADLRHVIHSALLGWNPFQ